MKGYFQLSNGRSLGRLDCRSKKVKNKELSIVIQNMARYDIDRQRILDWTDGYDMREIFTAQSNKSKRMAKEFNEAVNGLDHLVFIVTSSKGNVFGCYTSVPIKRDTGNIWNDPKHFVFTLSNNIGVEPKIYKRRVEGLIPTLTLWDDTEEDNVFVVPGMCWISSEIKPSFIYTNFSLVYDDGGDTYRVFCESEQNFDKKSNGAFVSVKSLRVFVVKPIGRKLKIETSRVDKQEMTRFFSHYGPCRLDFKQSVLCTFDKVDDAVRCYKDRDELASKGYMVSAIN